MLIRSRGSIDIAASLARSCRSRTREQKVLKHMVEKCMFIVCTIRLHARNTKNVENARPAADGGGRLEERM